MKGAALRLGLYEHRFFRWRCAGYDLVMIQKSVAIVKAYDGEGPSQIWGGNSLAGNSCQRWLKLAAGLWKDVVQEEGPAARQGLSVGGYRAGTRSRKEWRRVRRVE